MFIIYDIIFILISIFYLPAYLFKRKFHKDFAMRFGIIPKDLSFERPIWVHCVSVGETMAVRGLVSAMRASFNGKKFLFSTVTPTGNKIAQIISSAQDTVTYLPLDLGFIVKKVIDRINPLFFVISETEIWPNMISYLHRKNIPIVVVNGRISDRSFRGYFLFKSLIRPILNKVSLFCVQTANDAQRLILLGVSPGKIKVTGNMKFDLNDSFSIQDSSALKIKLKLAGKDKVLLAGSTHPGEEGIILDIYKKLIQDYPYLKLIIAPRHPERSDEIERLITKKGFLPYRISANAKFPESLNPQCVFILDTIGELLKFYGICDIVFVGGSLVKKGGHNILEPAFLGKPVLFGPHMFNFSGIAQLFLKNEAAILVRNENEFFDAVFSLLGDPQKISAISARQKLVISNNRGATGRNLKILESLYV
jgi:3-deoxy-D-manno-octulosonic-acid transferase